MNCINIDGFVMYRPQCMLKTNGIWNAGIIICNIMFLRGHKNIIRCYADGNLAKFINDNIVEGSVISVSGSLICYRNRDKQYCTYIKISNITDYKTKYAKIERATNHKTIEAEAGGIVCEAQLPEVLFKK